MFEKWLLKIIFNQYEINIIFSVLHQAHKRYKDQYLNGEYKNEKVVKTLEDLKNMFI